MERDKRRITEVIRGLNHPCYEDRLRDVGSPRLEKIKLQGRSYSSLPAPEGDL